MLWFQHNEALNCESDALGSGLTLCAVSSTSVDSTDTPFSLPIVYLQNWVIRESVASVVTTSLKSSELPTSLALMWYECCNSLACPNMIPSIESRRKKFNMAFFRKTIFDKEES